jgi:hypothetical protein
LPTTIVLTAIPPDLALDTAQVLLAVMHLRIVFAMLVMKVLEVSFAMDVTLVDMLTPLAL